MQQSSNSNIMVISKVIANAMVDDNFRQILKASPVQVLRDQGLPIPPGREIQVVEDRSNLVHLTVPDHLPGQVPPFIMDDPVGRLILHAASNQDFRRELVREPRLTLQQEGWNIQPGIEYRVLIDTDHLNHLVIPQPPTEGELSDEELDSVAGGFAGCITCISCKPACVCVIGSCYYPDACS